MTATVEERDAAFRAGGADAEALHDEVGQIRDELRRAREQLRAVEQQRARAEQACRAKDEFLAMLGHELRNPLSPIVTALHLMRQKADADVGRERAVIERQVDHLVRLVDDLLDVARITSGKVELRRRRTDAGAVIEAAVELVATQIEQRRHRVDVVAPLGVLWVDGDRERLVQVVANLLSNAIKYTSPGGWIGVRAHRDGAEIVIEVRDDGIGIEAELLPHVFDLYVQGERPVERPIERSVDRCEHGLGIGLTIVKRLAELHGGSVQADSQGPGTGSTFTVRLPAASAELAAVAPTAAAPPRQRVLVIDDNVDVAELYAEVLRRHGHTVVVAHNGPAALQLAEAFRPDTALVDIGLPIMDGHELATKLREQLGHRCPRLIAISGYALDRDRDRSVRAGFEQHLVKPVDMHRLLELFGDRLLAPAR